MDPPLPRATLLSTEVRRFHSANMGQEYLLSCWFPPDYPDPQRAYPVLYLLDPEVQLGLISSLVLGFIWDQAMPSCLIVGVGHDVATYDEWFSARTTELTPPDDPDIAPPKRAADFLACLRTELIPVVETTYRVDPTDRCLVGCSRGGEFALYALLHDPDLFHRYFIGSAIWATMLPHYLAYEERLAGRRDTLPVRMFFSVGALEADQVPYVAEFVDVLQRRKFRGLEVETLVVEGETHASAGAAA